MRAIVQEGYGEIDSLRLGEIEIPDIGDDEVLVGCAPLRFIPTFGTSCEACPTC